LEIFVLQMNQVFTMYNIDYNIQFYLSKSGHSPRISLIASIRFGGRTLYWQASWRLILMCRRICLYDNRNDGCGIFFLLNIYIHFLYDLKCITKKESCLQLLEIYIFLIFYMNVPYVLVIVIVLVWQLSVIRFNTRHLYNQYF